MSNYVPETKSIEVEILDLINQHRASLSLNRLNSMSEIKAEAYGHTDYMIENNEVSHEFFYQRKANLVSKVGASKVAENVAYAFSSPQSVVNAWLNS
ncbi:MAG: CAP domain-containing protein, partial [Bacteroidia bacterium]|nr:CAP domain-containing protein [Bacteroidia bacterium]